LSSKDSCRISFFLGCQIDCRLHESGHFGTLGHSLAVTVKADTVAHCTRVINVVLLLECFGWAWRSQELRMAKLAHRITTGWDSAKAKMRKLLPKATVIATSCFATGRVGPYALVEWLTSIKGPR